MPMSNEKPDWESFRKRIIIEKPINQVYEAWAIPDKIMLWFLQQAQYSVSNQPRPSPQLIQKGDTFKWKWHNWDFEESGSVLEANGKDKIAFTFGQGGNVSINLKTVTKGTEVLLTQDDIPADDQGKMSFYVGCSTGWTFWLTNLKAWMEYNITLNAKGLSQGETRDLVNS